MRAKTHLIGAAVVAGLAATTPATAQSFSFENGNLNGWMQGGTAFRLQPTFGNNIAPRLPGATPGHDGDYWIGSFEARTSAAVPAGTTQGDAPTGALISPLFTILDNSLSLLVGGGADAARLHVDLLVESGPGDRGGGPSSGVGAAVNVPEGVFRVHATATGENNETMRRVEWDTRPVVGRRARIMIMDEASGPWGHINVDDIRPSNRIVAAAPASRPPVAMPVGGGPVSVTVPGAQPVHSSPVLATPVGAKRPPIAMPVGGDPKGPGTGVRGRFRVTAMKFAVEHQTSDTATESDGRGDEVWVQADIFPLGRDGSTTGGTTLKSARIGERGDLVGGSSRPGPFAAGQEVGGFVTGDIYPPSGARPRANDLPMTIWEGWLEQGGNGVMIIPTIWEYDHAGIGYNQRSWTNSLENQLSAHRSALALAVSSAPRPGEAALYTAMRSWVMDDGNRPIGVWNRRDGDRQTVIKALILNYDRATRIASSGDAVGGPGGGLRSDIPDPESRALIFGGRGDVVIRYLDREGLDGNYALLIHVERTE